jgi:hypothetical protein
MEGAIETIGSQPRLSVVNGGCGRGPTRAIDRHLPRAIRACRAALYVTLSPTDAGRRLRSLDDAFGDIRSPASLDSRRPVAVSQPVGFTLRKQPSGAVVSARLVYLAHEYSADGHKGECGDHSPAQGGAVANAAQFGVGADEQRAYNGHG